MMLPVENIVLGLKVRDKPALLRELGRIAVRCGAPLDGAAITAALARREELGSTGLGSGFALPHASLPGLEAPVIALVRLAEPVAFDAIDGAPVDIACLLLTPAQGAAHVATLAAASRLFRGAGRLDAIRAARTAGAVAAAVAAGQG